MPTWTEDDLRRFLGKRTDITARPKTVVAVLPYPPSANRYWRSMCVGGRPRVVVSDEAKRYKIMVKRLLPSVLPLDGDLRMDLEIVRPRKRGDLSNRIKVLEDALQGVLFHDDAQIVELHAVRRDRSDSSVEPRVTVTVTVI